MNFSNQVELFLSIRDCNCTSIDSPEWYHFRICLIAISLAVQIIGTTMLSGIIHYEHYGGDPQKRTILNQLVSFISICGIVGNLLLLTIFNWRLTIGPINPMVATYLFFVFRVGIGIAILLSLNQLIIIRYNILRLHRFKEICDTLKPMQ
jgi:hypothetical protein